jgi:hypothetical protein
MWFGSLLVRARRWSMVDVGRGAEGLTSETAYELSLVGQRRRACVGERGLKVRCFLWGALCCSFYRQLSQ